jgi:hypothetical protein
MEAASNRYRAASSCSIVTSLSSTRRLCCLVQAGFHALRLFHHGGGYGSWHPRISAATHFLGFEIILQYVRLCWPPCVTVAGLRWVMCAPDARTNQ